MAGGFKRSGVFGIVGVIVVAALIIVIATSTGEGQANPKTTYALIFGVLAVFLVVLFTLQRGDLNRVSGADARETSRGAAEGGRQVDNPTTLGDAELWAAMAVKPIDREAIEARAAMWGSARRSQNLAMLVTLLILLTVPSIYLLESFVPLLIGGPLIVIAALWGSIKALMPGGELDRGYDNVSTAMAPLGLTVTERPTVSIEMREPVTPRMGPKIRGALVLSGERNGRRTSIRVGETDSGSRSEVSLAAPLAEFEARSRKVTVSSGLEGIVVQRKGGGQSDWLCDLWLAERIAEG